jgi:hypothetical protein
MLSACGRPAAMRSLHHNTVETDAMGPRHRTQQRATAPQSITTSTITDHNGTRARCSNGRATVKRVGRCRSGGPIHKRRKKALTEGFLGPAWCPFIALVGFLLQPSRGKGYARPFSCDVPALRSGSEREGRTREERAGAKQGRCQHLTRSEGGGIHLGQSYIRLSEATGDVGSARSLRQLSKCGDWRLLTAREEREDGSHLPKSPLACSVLLPAGTPRETGQTSECVQERLGGFC